MIYETIITTQSEQGQAHIAPMGIRRTDGMVTVAPFRPSRSLSNILREKCLIINFTDDVRVFAGCLTGRFNWPIEKASCIAGYRLANSLAHLEAELLRVEEDEVRPRLICKIVHQETHAIFPGFNRAQAAVIEGAVLISRLDRLPREKVETEIAYLSIAINKTAGPREIEAWQWLLERVHDFYQRSCSDV